MIFRLLKFGPPSVTGVRAVKRTHGQISRSLSSSRSDRVIAKNRVRAAHTESIKPEPISSHQIAFPCLDKVEQRTKMLSEEGPEPIYSKATGYQTLVLPELEFDCGRVLKDVKLAYETWGELNADKSNAILLHTGLSASSHAKSQPENTAPGWWEKFIGPGLSVDTSKFFVICSNVIGGCYGSTGPSSAIPGENESEPYATRFPIITIHDMVRAQHQLIKHLGIDKLYCSLGSSMGGLQSLAFARDFPGSVYKVASISGCARSHPASIAMRHVQRQAIMADPNWNRGFYYNGIPPHVGMKLARQLATITYRSGPEWDDRFGRDRVDPSRPPALCPDFLIESYLDHQGEKFCLQYDPNSLLYISKAQDMFDLGAEDVVMRERARRQHVVEPDASICMPSKPYEEKPRDHVRSSTKQDLVAGLKPMADSSHPTFVLGVQSDSLFPAWQQQEIADCLREAGNKEVEYHELDFEQSKYGHDTFLLDLENVGLPLKKFLEREFA